MLTQKTKKGGFAKGGGFAYTRYVPAARLQEIHTHKVRGGALHAARMVAQNEDTNVNLDSRVKN